MNKELDPKLSRLFADYAPAIESSVFLARMQTALDLEERRARWRFAIGWTAVAMLMSVIAVYASAPLARVMALASGAFATLHTSLPIAPTPMNVSLFVALVGLCLHRRIRALLWL